MLLYIENKTEIGKANKILENTLRQQFDTHIRRTYSHPGGTEKDVPIWANNDVWCRVKDHRPDKGTARKLFLFGLMKEKGNLTIQVQANVPYSGINNTVAGFYAKDLKTNQIYLMHSGGLGGGTKGVSKTHFLNWSKQKRYEVKTTEGDSRIGFIAMPIKGQNAINSIMAFTHHVNEFRNLIYESSKSPRKLKNLLAKNAEFNQEASGRRQGKKTKITIDYESRHGDVVNQLESWRRNTGIPPGSKLFNRGPTGTQGTYFYGDLGLLHKKKIKEVYEVKTSTDRQSLYTGLGQLMVFEGQDKGLKYLVIPKNDTSLPKDIQLTIERYQIHIIWYDITKSKISFLSEM